MLSPLNILWVLVINAIFSGAYVIGKIGVNHFPPFLFAAMRFFIVIICLLPFLRINKNLITHWKSVFTFCLAMGVGVYGTMYWALYLADGASAILIGTQLSTPVAVLLGVYLLKERVTFWIWIGIFIATSGVMIVGFDVIILGYPFVFLLIVLSACCYALANVSMRMMRNTGISIMNLNVIMAIISTPILFFISLITDEPWQESIQQADSVAWMSVIYSSLVVSLVGHLGMFFLLKKQPIVAVMPFYVFTPIFGVIGSILFLNEQPTLRFYTGASIAIIGVFVINHIQKKSAVNP